MSDRAKAPTLPRRDADGRVISLPEFVGMALAYTIVNGVGLALIDGLIALVGLTDFGRSTGWLMLILPGLLFFDELRAWRGYGVRFLVGIVSAVVAIGVGLIGAAVARDLPPILSGGVGAVIAVMVYAPLWFLSIRWLTGERSS
jgi:hypothetical protein